MNEHSSKYKQPDFKYYVKPNTSCYDYYTFQDLEEACIRAKTLSLTEFPVSLLYEPIETENERNFYLYERKSYSFRTYSPTLFLLFTGWT